MNFETTDSVNSLRRNMLIIVRALEITRKIIPMKVKLARFPHIATQSPMPLHNLRRTPIRLNINYSNKRTPNNKESFLKRTIMNFAATTSWMKFLWTIFPIICPHLWRSRRYSAFLKTRYVRNQLMKLAKAVELEILGL